MVSAPEFGRKGSGPGVWPAGALLVAVLVLPYLNTFHVPFLFDDVPAIAENQSLRRLWPLSAVLHPALDDGGVTVSGRPLVNLSLAINYRVHGPAVFGYHLGNLLVHAVAALALFGVLRRTLLLPRCPSLTGVPGIQLAWVMAAIWALHPLQTESVTYIVQRAEALMALCFLLTLYGLVRSVTSAQPRRWENFSIAFCFAGMACKEVMVAAPVVAFLYDRTFVAGSFAQAWRQRRRLYVGLAASWGLLAVLVAGTGGRGGTAGFGTEVSAGNYLLTQCEAWWRYVALAFWPQGQVFDYGTGVVAGFSAVWWQATGLILAATATVLALRKGMVAGFLAGTFMAILAPSSSVVPIVSQTQAEHRIYLPLAALVVGVVWLLVKWLGRPGLGVAAGLAVAAGGLTWQRNMVYRSATALWTDTVAKVPTNPRAHNNLGDALLAAGDPAAALGHFETAIALRPSAPEPHFNRGLALSRLGRRGEALASYGEALRIRPRYPDALNNLGIALQAEGRLVEAHAQFEAALALNPTLAVAQSNLASVLLDLGRPADAAAAARQAVQLDPAAAAAHLNLGNALAASGDVAAARDEFELAWRLNPGDADAAHNLAGTLVQLGQIAEAAPWYERALAQRPDWFEARRNLALCFIHVGDFKQAVVQFRELCRQRPDDVTLRDELAQVEQAAAR